MNQNKLVALIALILLIVLTIGSSVYSVDEREKVIVVRFGQILRSDDPPGMHFKAPFMDEVRYFDSRVLTLDQEPLRFLTKEKKYVIVDSYVKWRISDARQYYLAVSGSEASARQRLEQLISSGLRDEVNKRDVQSVVSADRAKIMQLVTQAANAETRKFGIEVLDVRVQRVDLPPEVSVSVFDRMKAERLRIANDLRAQGAEAAEKIRSDAERQREILLAEAYGKAEKIRGEGDARAISIYSAAAGQAPEFYSFYRSLGAYRESFRQKEDILIIDPSADFFKYLKKPTR